MAETLSLTQTAQRLGVSERTVYRLMEQGELHPFKMGKYWRFDAPDVEAYVTRSREASAKTLTERQARHEKTKEVA